MVTCADPEGRGIEGSHPPPGNHKFYGFLELTFGPPPPWKKFDPPWKRLGPPGKCWTPPPPPETL